MKISVIIPVYNAEQHLRKCIESIRNQTYENLEILIVDDGSTDNSNIVYQQEQENDRRIKTFKQNNRGVSSARNKGIENASGDYLIFIDADDYIEKDMLAKLLETSLDNDAGISMCGLIKENNSGEMLNEIINIEKLTIYDKYSGINNILDKNKYHGYISNKLFRADIINNHNPLRFDENIYICEDLLFCCEAFLRSERIAYNEKQYYHYVLHETNSSKKFNKKKLTALTAYEKIFQLFEKYEVHNVQDFKNAYNRLVLGLLFNNLRSKHEKQDNINELLMLKLSRFRIQDLSNLIVISGTIIAKTSPKLLLLFSVFK